ncbi:MAG: DUF1634 domain-containing protein [Candidatus Bathyarchaeota archaeon]|nr:DUF1634 domain-containing protein [Candidatus Bathyarchaeota archaeon]
MNGSGLGNGESKLENAISYLLIIGVSASVIFEIIGITLYFQSYGNLQISQANNVYISGENFFAFIYQTVTSLFANETALTFMTLGIIILILTPYMRAIASVAFFVWEKNKAYILVTLFVLAVLTISLALH